MSRALNESYKRVQTAIWLAWPTILDALPLVQGETVLDLGCGVGNLAAEFVNRGSRVIGVEAYEEFLFEARSRRLSNAEFLTGDLRSLTDLGTRQTVFGAVSQRHTSRTCLRYSLRGRRI